jgi:replicative DNA helicase
MTVWAARTSMGKSALALHFAESQALDQDLRVAFFALEMSAEQLMARRNCHKVKNLQGLSASWQDVRSKNISQSERLALYELVRSYATRIKGKLDIYDATHFTSRDIERIQRKLRYDVIYIDHGGLLKDKPRRGERWDQLIGRFTLNLHELAKNTYCVVNLVWQLNRETGSRAGNRPSLTDLRDSGKIEENADNVVLLHRESYWGNTQAQAIDPMELILAKFRDGARAFSCYVGFDLAAQKFVTMKAEDMEQVAEDRMEQSSLIQEGEDVIPF